MIDNVNVVSIFSCSSSSDGVLHMEVDKVADEVANMVVDMEVDKRQTGRDYLAGIPGARAVLQFLQCLTFPNDGIDTKSNSLDPSVWFAHMSLAYQPCDQPCRHILS